MLLTGLLAGVELGLNRVLQMDSTALPRLARLEGKLIEVANSGGVSPLDGNAAFRKAEADYGSAWYKAISTDIWDR